MRKDAEVGCGRLWLTGLLLAATLSAPLLADASDAGPEAGTPTGTSGETANPKDDEGGTGEQEKGKARPPRRSQRFVPSTKLPADSPVSLPTDI